MAMNNCIHTWQAQLFDCLMCGSGKSLRRVRVIYIRNDIRALEKKFKKINKKPPYTQMFGLCDAIIFSGKSKKREKNGGLHMYHFLQECAAKLLLQLRAAKMIFTIWRDWRDSPSVAVDVWRWTGAHGCTKGRNVVFPVRIRVQFMGDTCFQTHFHSFLLPLHCPLLCPFPYDLICVWFLPTWNWPWG